MGFFHKTIKNMKDLGKKGKYDEAKKILEKHISEEHLFESDISSLMRAIASYQQGLMNFEKGWESWTKNPNEYAKMIEHLEGQIIGIKYLIKKLIKDEKIKIE